MTETERLLEAAILRDDGPDVAERVRRHPGSAATGFRGSRLYRVGLAHWVYAGDTWLHLAAATHATAAVAALLAAGADPDAARSRRKASPVHYAADGAPGDPCWDEARQVGTLRLLLAAGGDLHRADANGATPLHRAVRTRSAGAAELLLRAGADPAARNRSGSTPFHLAVATTGRGGSGDAAAVARQKRILRLFLDAGVPLGLVGAGGRTVRELADRCWVGRFLDDPSA